MAEQPVPPRTAIGLTVKSGWAAVVMLHGPASAPRVGDSGRVDLSDPAIPESRQPYHAAFGTARSSGPELSRLLGGVRRFGTRSVTAVIRQHTAGGRQLAGAGIVVGSLIEPEHIANAHIRIHAQEGQLFRRVVEDAVCASGLSCAVWRERDLYGIAADALKQPEQEIRSRAKALGKAVAGAWRAEQQAAAVAAWLILATPIHSAVRRAAGGQADGRRTRRSNATRP